MLHTYLADNPRRPVNWRYERARSIGAGGPPLSRRLDDAWVHRALRFRRAYERCNDEGDFFLCARRFPEIYWAHDIWEAAQLEGGSTFKSELEARILADDSHENITNRLGTPPEVIDAYCRIFFDIEERRGNRGYLVHQVLGPSIYAGLQEQEYDILWKLFALMGGPVALDMMIDGFAGTAKPTSSADLGAFLSDVTQNAIRRKAMLAAMTVRVNAYNAVELIAGFLKLLEIERAAGRGGAGSEALLDNVDRMLKALPIQVGGRVRHVDVPALDQYDTQGAELRSDEMLGLGFGREGPDAATLAKFAFPPPPERPAAAG